MGIRPKGIKVNENWRNRYNKEFMQLFGDLVILPLVRRSRLIWIGHVNRMDNKRKVCQVFYNNPQGSRLNGRPKSGWWNYVQTVINKFKIKNWKDMSRNRADWENSIKEASVRIGL
jgi:hypothetical protein